MCPRHRDLHCCAYCLWHTAPCLLQKGRWRRLAHALMYPHHVEGCCFRSASSERTWGSCLRHKHHANAPGSYALPLESSSTTQWLQILPCSSMIVDLQGMPMQRSAGL